MRTLALIIFASASCAIPARLPSTLAPLARPAGSCSPARDHCVRPTTWFLVEHALPGSASPATPVHEMDGRWVSYETGEAARDGYALHTELARAEKTKVRDVLVVWRPYDDEPLWPVSEEAAQTTGRWVVMVVDTIDPDAATFTIQGRDDVPIPLAAARGVVETRAVRLTSPR